MVHFIDGLKFSLLSVAHICDKVNKVKFRSNKCTVIRISDNKEVLIAWRNKNMYFVDLTSCESKNMACLNVQEDVVDTWHRRLGHMS